MERMFTVEEARALLPELRQRAERIVRLRADLADAQAALAHGGEPRGGLARAKAAEAHLHEALEWFATEGIQVKGVAPLLLDFPSELAGQPVLLCWLEGETTLSWYHPPETGFMGRRPLTAS